MNIIYYLMIVSSFYKLNRHFVQQEDMKNNLHNFKEEIDNM